MSGTVMTGADQLTGSEVDIVRGKKLGLLTNPTGINSKFQSTIDICASLPNAKLSALFACEHGIRGEKQAGLKFSDEMDPQLNIPVFSLYGEHRKPTPEMLERIDTLIFDIQDLGVRFYTYLTTLVYAMESCAAAGKSLIVLDRPNPLGGTWVEGGLLQEGYESMVGVWKIPYRTGLTIGEFAKLANEQMNLHCDLTVIPLINWKRRMEYPETGLPWLMPSPNIPALDTARIYTGTCLFEGSNVSEGRGTTKPFEIIGAPWLHAKKLSNVMNDLELPGIHFHPTTFTPMFSKHQGELCEGLQCFVTDPKAFEAVTTGLHLLHHLIDLHPDRFEWLERPNSRPFVDYLTGGDVVRMTIHNTSGLEQILQMYEKDVRQWKRLREPYLIYGEV